MSQCDRQANDGGAERLPGTPISATEAARASLEAPVPPPCRRLRSEAFGTSKIPGASFFGGRGRYARVCTLPVLLRLPAAGTTQIA